MKEQQQDYFCKTCDKMMRAASNTCFRCGQPLRTLESIRTSGKFIIFGGAIIALFGVLGVLVGIAILIFMPDGLADGITAMLSFGVPLAIGIRAIVIGKRQVKSGRPSEPLMDLSR